MKTLREIERCALKLPVQQRAQLTANLLGSLPIFSTAQDNGFAEAQRRDAEMDAQPDAHRSEEEFRTAVLAARKRH